MGKILAAVQSLKKVSSSWATPAEFPLFGFSREFLLEDVEPVLEIPVGGGPIPISEDQVIREQSGGVYHPHPALSHDQAVVHQVHG